MKEIKLVVNQRQNQVFFPGSEVSGSLVIEADTVKTYKYIKFVLDGRAFVTWSKSETFIRRGGYGGSQGRRTVYYSETEVFASGTIVVWEKSQAPGGVMQPGRYEFRFRFVLPPRLPPSFEGGVGYIRYQVQCRIGTDARQFDHVVTHPLAVSEVVDAANNPAIQQPLQYEQEKTISFLFCASGSITTRAQVERSGFCVGDSIPVTVEIENGSRGQVTVSASLYQNVVFSAQGRTREMSRHFAGVDSDAIPAHTTRTWNPGDALKIPLTTTSLSPTSCSIILITYLLKVTTIVPGSVNGTITIPIVIGNVPSRSRNQAPGSSFLPELRPPPTAPEFSQPPPTNPVFSQPPATAPLFSQLPPTNPVFSQPPPTAPVFSQPPPTAPIGIAVPTFPPQGVSGAILPPLPTYEQAISTKF